MATSREMTEGRALPLIFNFTLPLLLGNLLQQTYSLVDAAIVGRFLGINALASVGASTSVVFLILGFCNGCCGGFGIPVAQKFGARDYVTMRRYVAVSLQLAAVMSVVIAVVTSIYCADILHMMSTPENIFTGAYYYLLVTFIGVPFTFFYNLLSSIIRALGDSKKNSRIITVGEIQTMSAGTGIFHSEVNASPVEPVEFLQIWIMPRERNTHPVYKDFSIKELERPNELAVIVSPDGSTPASLLQDTWFSIGKVEAGKKLGYHLHQSHGGVYIFLIEGEIVVDGEVLKRRDGMGVYDTKSFELETLKDSHILLIEVPM